MKAERLLLCAYIGYIHYELIEEEQNFVTLLDMINESETREDDENFQNGPVLLEVVSVCGLSHRLDGPHTG